MNNYETTVIKNISLIFVINHTNRCWERLCNRRKEYHPRNVPIGLRRSSDEKYPKNVIRNQKYSVFTFIPKVCVKLKL